MGTPRAPSTETTVPCPQAAVTREHKLTQLSPCFSPLEPSSALAPLGTPQEAVTALLSCTLCHQPGLLSPCCTKAAGLLCWAGTLFRPPSSPLVITLGDERSHPGAPLPIGPRGFHLAALISLALTCACGPKVIPNGKLHFSLLFEPIDTRSVLLD